MKSYVDPWKVEGEVDYNKLINEFGVEKITPQIIKKLPQPPHKFLELGFFSFHRDLGIILDQHKKGIPFALATGRGPSGKVHIAHLLIWKFAKWLQDSFDCNLYFQITDDEKFLFNRELEFNEVQEYAKENILDIAAVGFNPDKTFIFKNTEYTKIYKMAAQISKTTTINTVRDIFGESVERNPGAMFFPCMQAAHLMMANFIEGPTPVIVPMAIDQDPYIRISRDAAPKLGFPKPGAIHSKFLPAITGMDGKMSASKKETAIFLDDSESDVDEKIKKHALTAGRATIEEQRKLGGEADKCVVYKWLTLLEPLSEGKKIYSDCYSGKILCKEDKERLSARINEVLEEHRKAKMKAEKLVDKFMYSGRLAKKAWEYK
ncbi:MAG TPA: tryptophan--tRNA ligase [archaeon]|nr:tryptophan--tRNA ligase [archaeon]